jgi:hypothetical protein
MFPPEPTPRELAAREQAQGKTEVKLDYQTPLPRQPKRWWRWAAAVAAVLLISLFVKFVLPVLAWAMIANDMPAPDDPPTTTPSTQPSFVP